MEAYEGPSDQWGLGAPPGRARITPLDVQSMQSGSCKLPVTACRAKRENGGLGEDPLGGTMTYEQVLRTWMFSQSGVGAVPVTAHRAKRENGDLGEPQREYNHWEAWNHVKDRAKRDQGAWGVFPQESSINRLRPQPQRRGTTYRKNTLGIFTSKLLRPSSFSCCANTRFT